MTLHRRTVSPYVLLTLAIASWVLGPSVTRAQTSSVDEETAPVTVPPIEVNGSTADVLLYDPVAPTRASRTQVGTASGSLVRQFEEQLPVPVTDNGNLGGLTQLRGLGRGADDTNVQTLGIPLNPVIGGGFDLSTFPQFFWSKYLYHLGTSTGAFDPSATTSTLTLVPWTAEAIRQDQRPHFRLTEMVTRGLNQTSIGASYGRVAALVGISAVNAQGPTGSISGVITHSDSLDVRAHFLGTSIDVASPGSIQFPSPDARQISKRWIPVIEGTWNPSSDLAVKETLFYDQNSIRLVNPDDHSMDSYDRTRQFGSETALLWKDWTLGASIRKANLVQIAAEAPSVWIGHAQLERLFVSGASTTQIAALAEWENLYGFRPGAILGERYDLNDKLGVFAKVNYSYRYPTLQDRYYSGVYYVVSPDLSLERALSFNLGTEYKDRNYDNVLQGFLQFRSNAQILKSDPNTYVSTVVNGGKVHELSLLDDFTWHPERHLDLTNSLRLSDSLQEFTDTRIPYDPLLTEVIRARVHEASEDPTWGFGGALRTVTRSPYTQSIENPGYALMDIGADYRIRHVAGGRGDLRIQGEIDNLLNRPVQVSYGYPLPGRLFALSLVGSL